MGIINVQNAFKMHANRKGKSTWLRIVYSPHVSQNNITEAEVCYAQDILEFDSLPLQFAGKDMLPLCFLVNALNHTPAGKLSISAHHFPAVSLCKGRKI